MRSNNDLSCESPLKNSTRFGANTAPPPATVLMRKRSEDFLPGNLVFAQFPGYSWPALVTQVGPKTLQVFLLILETDEFIERDKVVIFRGTEQLRKIMSVLTPGEQQDFSEASKLLLDLRCRTRQERIDYMKSVRPKLSESDESSKENDDTELTSSVAVENNISSPMKEVKKLPCDIDDVSSPMKEVKKLPCDIDDIALTSSVGLENNISSPLKEVKKLPCDIDDVSSPMKKVKKLPCDIEDITLPVSCVLDTLPIIKRPKLTLEVGQPNFSIADPLPDSDDEVVIQLHGMRSTATITDNSVKKQMETKQQQDEDYITSAVKLTNKILESGAPIEVARGYSLSYDSLKIARERAMLIAGCANPFSPVRRKSKSHSAERASSSELELASPDQNSSKAHIDHLRATRAAQKEAVKSLTTPLEIIQTTVKNPSRRGRKSSVNVPDVSPLTAKQAFNQAAEQLVANSAVSTEALQTAANLTAQALLATPILDPAMPSPKRKRRSSKRLTSSNVLDSEIIVNTKTLEHIQKELSPQKQPPAMIHTDTECTKGRGNKLKSSELTKQPVTDRDSSRKSRSLKNTKIHDGPSDDDMAAIPITAIEGPGLAMDVEPPRRSSKGKEKESQQQSSSNDDISPINIVSFLTPYYLNLFTDAIKEQIENQIIIDIEKLSASEKDMISKLAEGNARGIRKQAYEVVSKLVKTSPFQSLVSSKLPEVGPETPPASPKTESQRVSNNIIPAPIRKRSSNSATQDILHNPFPIDSFEMTERQKRKYLNSDDSSGVIGTKCSAIPRVWEQHIKPTGRLSNGQYSGEKLKSSSRKSDNSKLKKSEPEITPGDGIPEKSLVLLLYIKDLQNGLKQPLKLKPSDVKWDELSPESQEEYTTLADALLNMSSGDRIIHQTAFDLFLSSRSSASLLSWNVLTARSRKKFINDANKISAARAIKLSEISEYAEKLVTKMLKAKSRKRKRESQPAVAPPAVTSPAVDTDSEPSTKKEKGDDTLKDFFCMDCFTLDYNPKQYEKCSGCQGIFHKTCLKSQSMGTSQKQKFLCNECQTGEICSICRRGENLKTCSKCPYKYHEDCVLPHMSSQVISSTSFICPYHVCGSCEARPETNIKNFVRCVRCPQSFHENHLPAGSMRISKSHILCFRHHKGFKNKDIADKPETEKQSKKRKRVGTLSRSKKLGKPVHLNVSFCFQCTFGGDLICCEGCPASFHNECVPEDNQIKEGQVSWLCPDCIVGKKPFIGDIVWVKFGSYRWWPCQVLDELELPDNIFAKPHTPCQFPVICLGTREFAWLDMGRVYSYEDGDKGSSSSTSGAQNFKLAIVEAKDLHSKVKPVKEALLQQTSSLDKPSSKKPAPFRFIKSNVAYNSNMKEYEKQLKLERMPFPCDCTLDDKCSADSSCINRVLLTECPPGCKWKELCENQRFQRRQYPKTKLVKTEGRGWGMISLEDIVPGTLVHEYVGEIIDEQEVERRLQDYQTSGITDYYMLTIENSRIIDAKPKANNARFMNHSCDPNSETQKWNVCGLTCIGLFAKRNIKCGEELTFDYQFDTRGQEKKACLCGSSNCSGFLGVPAKKIVEQTNKEPSKKKRKKRKKKKTTPKDKSDETDSDKPDKKPTTKGRPRKTPALPVKTAKKPTIKSSTKAILKKVVMAKSNAISADIDEDLQKINEIVNSVSENGIGSGV